MVTGRVEALCPSKDESGHPPQQGQSGASSLCRWTYAASVELLANTIEALKMVRIENELAAI